MEITSENKSQICDDFVKRMLKITEDELNAVGRKYRGLGPNRRQQFKNALAKELEATVPTSPVPDIPTPPVPSVDTHIPSEIVSQLAPLGFTESRQTQYFH